MENQTEQNASKTTVPSNCFEQPGEQVNLVLEHEQIEDAVEPEIQMAVKPRRTNRTKTGKSKIMNNNGVQPKTTVNLFTTPSSKKSALLPALVRIRTNKAQACATLSW